jgi:hypothetical protein
MPEPQGRRITEADLGRQVLRGFALTDPAQKQHDLHRCQVRLLKHRAAVQVVRRLTRRATIRRQITAPRAAKYPGVGDWLLTTWTFQLTRMKMLKDPNDAAIVIEKIGNWEFHAPSLPAPHTFVR